MERSVSVSAIAADSLTFLSLWICDYCYLSHNGAQTRLTVWRDGWSTVVRAVVVWSSSSVRQVAPVALEHAASFNSSDAADQVPRPSEPPTSSTLNDVLRCCCCWHWWWWWERVCSPTTMFVWCCSLICMCAACSCCWRRASCSIWTTTLNMRLTASIVHSWQRTATQYTCACRDKLRGLSSHPVGVENSPLKQTYSPWRRTTNFPRQGEYLYWRPADTSTAC